MTAQVLYRYFHAWHVDKGVVALELYPIVRETERCWFIQVQGVERRVLKGDGKRYAHERREWAAYSFRRRMRFERSHYMRALRKLDDVAATLILAWPGAPSEQPGVYQYELVNRKTGPLDIFDNVADVDVGQERGPFIGYGWRAYK